MEIDWTVLTGIGAIVTAIATIIKLYYLDSYRPYRKEKRFKEKKELESLKYVYDCCATSIETNIKDHIEKNELTNFKARLYDENLVGKAKISEEIKNQVQEYNEKNKEYNFFCKIAEPFIINTIEGEIKRMLPQSRKKSDVLDTMLCFDFLRARYFKGESVTTNWLKDKHPKALRNIIKEIDESERSELDVLFKVINEDFQKNDVLLRYRKKKKELIEHGKEAIKNLQTEIDSLNKQLEKYSDLKYEPVENYPYDSPDYQ